MRNIYIVVATDERIEREYAKIIKNKLAGLGPAQFCSLALTSTRLKEVFYSVGEEYFGAFLGNKAEFGPECNYHILVFSETEHHICVLEKEIEKIIKSVKNTFGSWSERFKIRFFSVIKREQCHLFERIKQYNPVYYDIESDGTEINKNQMFEKALMLYVRSIETVISHRVDDDRKIQENKSIFYYPDRDYSIVDPCESKEIEKIIKSVKNTFGSWSERFKIRFFSVIKREQCHLFERIKQYNPVYYDIESEGTEINKNQMFKKALMLYVSSIETVISHRVDDDRKIQENKSILYYPDRDYSIVDPCESKVNPSGIEPELIKDIFNPNTRCGGEKMSTKEIFIFSASSAKLYKDNIMLLLQQTLNRRGGSGEYSVHSWDTPGTFMTGETTLPALVKWGIKLKENGGFALCLFTPDDSCTINGEKVFVSRDNVWLEYGLFSGLLGLDHVFVLCPDPKAQIQKKEENGIAETETRCWHYPSDFSLQGYYYNYTGDYRSDETGIQITVSNIVDEIIKKSRLSLGTGSVGRTQYPDGGRRQDFGYGFKTKL